MIGDTDANSGSDLDGLRLLCIRSHSRTVDTVGDGTSVDGITGVLVDLVGQSGSGAGIAVLLIERRSLGILSLHDIGGQRILIIHSPLLVLLTLLLQTVIDLRIGLVGVDRCRILSALDLIGIALHIGAHSQREGIGIIVVDSFCLSGDLAGHGAIGEDLGGYITHGQVQSNRCANGSGSADSVTAGSGLGLTVLACQNSQITCGDSDHSVHSLAAHISLHIIVDQANGNGSINGDILGRGIGDHDAIDRGGIVGITSCDGVGTGHTDGLQVVLLHGLDIKSLGDHGPTATDTGVNGHIGKGHGDGRTDTYGLTVGSRIVGSIAGGHSRCSSAGRTAGTGVATVGGTIGRSLVLIDTALIVQGGTGGSIHRLSAFRSDRDLAFRHGDRTAFTVGQDSLGLTVHDGQSQRTGNTDIGRTNTGDRSRRDAATDTVKLVIAAHSSGKGEGSGVDDGLTLLLVLDIGSDLGDQVCPAFSADDILQGHSLGQIVGSKGDDCFDQVGIFSGRGSFQILAGNGGTDTVVDAVDDGGDIVIGDGHAVSFLTKLQNIVDQSAFGIVAGSGGDESVDKGLDGEDLQDLLHQLLEEFLQIILGVGLNDLSLHSEAAAADMGSANIGDILIAHDVDRHTDTDTGGGVGSGRVGGDDTVGIILAVHQNCSLSLDDDAVGDPGLGVIALDIQDHAGGYLDTAFAGLGTLTVCSQRIDIGLVDVLGVCEAGHITGSSGILIGDLVSLTLTEEGLHGLAVIVVSSSTSLPLV